MFKKNLDGFSVTGGAVMLLVRW